MDRTRRAALVAFLIVFGSFAGTGVFLGFDALPAVVTGLVLGLSAALLIVGAARRADSFHPTGEPPTSRDPSSDVDLDAPDGDTRG